MINNPIGGRQQTIHGSAITSLDEFWLDYSRNAVRETITSLEEAAKQLIGILGFCQTVYFAALSFSEIKPEINLLSLNLKIIISILFTLPVLFWLISLIFAVRVFTPRDYNSSLDSPDLAQKFHQDISNFKYSNLSIAYWCLWVGFIPMLIDIILYLLYLPVVAP